MRSYPFGFLRIVSVVSSVVWVGCAPLRTVFAPQELTENYCRTPGTVAQYEWQGTVTPAPNLIDGDMTTVGETGREIVIILAEARPIRRIVIRDANYEDIILYVGGPGGEGDWKILQQIKQNRERTITIPLSVMTDRVRFRIGNTLDDSIGPAPRPVDGVNQRGATLKLAAPKAAEIEIYGFQNKTKSGDLF
jgi:hypothetical protein